MGSNWMSAIVLEMLVSIYNLAASIVLPIIFLKLILSRRSLNDLLIEESLFYCYLSFEEFLFSFLWEILGVVWDVSCLYY